MTGGATAAAMPYLLCGCGAATGLWMLCGLPETQGVRQTACLRDLDAAFAAAEGLGDGGSRCSSALEQREVAPSRRAYAPVAVDDA